MPRYKLTVAYDGTDFHGWQHQRGDDGVPLRTVQGVLQDAVRRVVREAVNVQGASRTDAGVHARAQVAAFTTDAEIPLERFALAINSRLPDDVQVRRVEPIAADFDPIADCRAKGYQYVIADGCGRRRLRPLFDRRYLTCTAFELDTAAMDRAARRLEGTHDFASFTRVQHGRDSTVRTILRCRTWRSAAERCVIDVSGEGFLYNMVRIIAGTLHEVGRGAIAPETMTAILEARDRRAAGPTLGPEGLRLMWMRYDDDGGAE